MSCNRWRLEKDENDTGSHPTTLSPPPIQKKIEYDDFDEEILPETDDFGEEIGSGDELFGKEEYVAYQKGRRDGLWITFEASTAEPFRIEFLENFIDCKPIISVSSE